jgi:hypothetical protein
MLVLARVKWLVTWKRRAHGTPTLSNSNRTSFEIRYVVKMFAFLWKLNNTTFYICKVPNDKQPASVRKKG